MTVRRALEQLRDEGLLASRKGAGWYVASFAQPLALGTFQHARSAVAEAGVSLARTVLEYGYHEAPSSISPTLGAGEMLRVRSLRRTGSSPLDVVTEWVPLALAAPVSRADAESPGTWETLRRNGSQISVVRQSIAAVAAGDIGSLLGVTAATPVLLVRRIALDAAEHPIALSEHHYLGHRFQLEVEFRGWPGAEPPGVAPIPLED